MKILVCDSLSNDGIEFFKNAGGITVDVKNKLSNEELMRIIKNYEGIVVRSSTQITKDVIRAAEHLKIIGRAGTGVDNIDVEEATKRGIIVMNTPGGNTITTAEHTISLMLSLSRNIPQADRSIKLNKWEKKKFIGTEIYNKILGIIGLGRVGSVVADRALGLKMKVIAFDPFTTTDTASKMGIELVDIDTLYAESDYITVHVPLTKETRYMLDKKAFKKMKKGVNIINCARGGIINEKDLYDAILDEKVASAAIDVFEHEPPGENPLLGLEQVICTPHLGASTKEAQINVAVAIAKQIVDFAKNETISNALNVPSVTGEIYKVLSPYLSLSERIGKFQGQLTNASIEEIHIEYSGEITELELEPLSINLLKGLLNLIYEETINFVNAPIIAKERGIKVYETKTSHSEDYASLITLMVKSKKTESLIAGTIFGKKDSRIVKINNFRLEAVPEGHILLIYTFDRPGVIGHIGTILGENGINISKMQFSREKKEGTSLILINTDEPVSKKVKNSLKKTRHFISINQVEL
ncbi:MAG: phosphoglycerate dehydrogenase [Thermodesulfobacteriota bacterium]|nr:phosphoglycerate dehydrogenase [Thermodesulfobacteriota bacterium]